MKAIRAWLRMYATTGTYPYAETGEESYRRHGHLLSAVHPLNGGSCDASGVWTQISARVDHAFAYGLKTWAQGQGQLYIPTVEVASAANFETVLNSATLRQTAIDNLLLLVNGTTTTGRFDSPWDGVDLRLEGVDISYKTVFNQWISDLADALHAVGKLLCVSPIGIEADSAGTLAANYYIHDYAILASKADYVTMIQDVGTLGTYDWLEQTVQYALGKGVTASKLFLGLTTRGQYYDGTTHEVSYTYGQTILAAASQTATWHEETGAGVRYRLKNASWNGGSNSMWVIDYDVWRVHTEIADRHGIAGVIMFGAGDHTYGEDESVWRAIEEWQARPIWSGYSGNHARCDIRADILGRFTRYRKVFVKSGTATTIVSDDLFEPDDWWKGALLYVLRDSERVGGRPEGQLRVVTSYTQSTHTLTVDHAFDNIAALDYPDEGDVIELYASSIPVAEVNRMIDEAIKKASAYWFAIARDTTTLDFVSSTFEYTLPTDVGVLRGVFVRNTSSDKWTPYLNWAVEGQPGAYKLITTGDAGAGDMGLIYETTLGWSTSPVTDASYLNILNSPSTRDHIFEQWAREYIVNLVLEKLNLRMMNEGDDAHASRRWNLARYYKQEHERIAANHAMPKVHGQVTRQGWMEHDYNLRDRLYTRLSRGGTEPGT